MRLQQIVQLSSVEDSLSNKMTNLPSVRVMMSVPFFSCSFIGARSSREGERMTAHCLLLSDLIKIVCFEDQVHSSGPSALFNKFYKHSDCVTHNLLYPVSSYTNFGCDSLIYGDPGAVSKPGRGRGEKGRKIFAFLYSPSPE